MQFASANYSLHCSFFSVFISAFMKLDRYYTPAEYDFKRSTGPEVSSEARKAKAEVEKREGG